MSLTDTALSRTERALEEARARVAEVEAAHAVMREAMFHMEGQRDAARAEVERLRGLLDQNEAEAHRLIRWRREAEATVERLRERISAALVTLEQAGAWTPRMSEARDMLEAALAGSPVETRRERIDPDQYVYTEHWCDGTTPCAVTSEPHGHWRGGRAVPLAEYDRALAERVRSHLIDYLYRSGYSFAGSLLRALDLDALLEEP